ncbi:uncharacterized protein LOC114536292 isoform X2 [Dendronephthya gigantea]|uniref:uncharacterized protein LOC114536292 isoform X2 n=1 Tax=Dendronephthya gigantea TaxID=151771 RepID=UPI00106B66A3|nr:uncharacterized protein LOC114536292 isoform X2 [Dendronephthya gigantea]
MKCHGCQEDKLSKEFPFYPLTEDCDHPILHCLDCATESVKKNNKCSQCETPVREDNEIYQEYLETLDFLFPTIKESEDDGYHQAQCTAAVSGNIYVTTISGESATLSYNPHRKILDIKREVESQLKTPPEKQRLLYQNKELKVRDEDRKMLTLRDHKVPPESKLHLIIVLCAVPDELENAVFDFFWGLPHGSNKDYLDVSVLVYSGRENLGVINYRYRYLDSCPGVKHSGPAKMNHHKREGRQHVQLNLKSVPHNVNKLVFTLSAWASANVSSYPYYRLNFYDVNFPDQQLCNDEVDVHLKDYRSIIMCCLSKNNGKWEVIDMKVGCRGRGFTRNYGPIKREIGTLIKDNLF